jgi:hypothetical protein
MIKILKYCDSECSCHKFPHEWNCDLRKPLWDFKPEIQDKIFNREDVEFCYAVLLADDPRADTNQYCDFSSEIRIDKYVSAFLVPQWTDILLGTSSYINKIYYRDRSLNVDTLLGTFPGNNMPHIPAGYLSSELYISTEDKSEVLTVICRIYNKKYFRDDAHPELGRLTKKGIKFVSEQCEKSLAEHNLIYVDGKLMVRNI